MDGHEPQVDEVPVTRDPTGSARTAVLVLAWTVCGLGFLALAIGWNAFGYLDVGPSFGRAALVTVPPVVVVHLVHLAVRRRVARRPGDGVPAGAPSVTVTGPPDPAGTDARPPAAGHARVTAAALAAGAVAVLSSVSWFPTRRTLPARDH